MRLGLIAIACVVLLAAAPARADDRWQALSPAQQQALAPLRGDWASLEPSHRAKWLELAGRFGSMPAEERQRLHERMAEWARLSPAERRTARLQFQEARRVSPEDRQAAWKAYQALPEAERQRLAEQQRARAPATRADARPANAASAPKPKVNVVQSPTLPPAKAANAGARQARPGATTSPMTQTPLPPAPIQHGLPKIAATPGFVDPATLLPRRGPQGAAAARPAAAASQPAPRP